MTHLIQTFPYLFSSKRARFALYMTLFVVLIAASTLLSRALSGDAQAHPAYGIKSQAAANSLSLFARTAHAGTLGATLDTNADEVWGQPNLTTNTQPITPSNITVSAPSDVVVFEPTGQIFIADTAHNRVLGWDSVDVYQNGDPADIVLGQPDFETTLALNPPTEDSMNAPMGIAVGFDGFLYVSDTGNNRVLVFVPCNDFYGFYEDENGDDFSGLYGCDEDDVLVESSVNAPQPTFTSGMDAYYALGQPNMESGTALATSEQTLNAPMGLVTDANDNLAVADYGNNRVLIFEWPLETGTHAMWVVGQGEGQVGNDAFYRNAAPNPPTSGSLNGPTDVAVNAQSSELYVADSGNNRVLVFADEPFDIFADRVLGQLDFTSNEIDGGQDDVNASGFDAPTYLAVDSGNRILVSDTGNNRVLVFDQQIPDGVADDVFGQEGMFDTFDANANGVNAGSLSTPLGVATDAFNMDVFIADADNHRVLQFDRPLIDPAPAIFELDPGSVRAGSDGFTLTIKAAGLIEGTTILNVNNVQRDLDINFLGTAATNIEASEVATAGNLTLQLTNPSINADSNAVDLIVYAPQADDTLADSVMGQEGFTTDYGEFVIEADTLFEPSGLVVDPNSGRVFVADRRNGRILIWSSINALQDGQPAEIVIGQPDFESWLIELSAVKSIATPVGLALDSQGNLYATDAQTGRVHIFEAPFTSAMTFSMAISDFENPLGLVLDSNDNLYVADALTHRVLFYETPLASGDTTADRVYGQADFNGTEPNQGGAASAETLNFPSGVALDASGNLYVSDNQNHRVLVYQSVNGVIDATADAVIGQADFSATAANQGGAVGSDTLNGPYGLTFNAVGTLFVADMDNHRVVGYENPVGGNSADIIYGQPSARQSAPNQNSPTINRGTLELPTDVAVSAQDGTLYIADRGNNRVLGFLNTQVPTAVSVQAQQSTATPSASPTLVWLLIGLAMISGLAIRRFSRR